MGGNLAILLLNVWWMTVIITPEFVTFAVDFVLFTIDFFFFIVGIHHPCLYEAVSKGITGYLVFSEVKNSGAHLTA